MKLVNFAADGSGSISAELGTRSGVKNKCSVGPQSRGASYKKPKKPVAVDGLVESSAGVSNVMDESGNGPNIGQLWASEINSKVDSISGVSDLDNLENVVVEETSYAESDVSGLDDDMNDATPRKTHTCTYVLNSKPPPLSFNVLSDGEDTLPLPSPKFCGSNHLPPVGSRAPEKWSFILSKLFALDIELSAVSGKTIGNKLVCVKKIFYQVDGFGGASTPSKFPGIIRSSFTSEKSLFKAREMAISEKILVNDDLRKVNSHSDWEVIVKEIPVNLPKSAIEAVFSKFDKIVSIKVQLIGLWQKALVEYESSEMADLVAARWFVLMGKDSVYVAKANIDKQMWVSRDQHRALLYTLPVGTNAYDLSSLLESYGGKTCYIGCNPSSYVCDRCAVICFGDEASKLAAIGTVPVFRNVSLHWAGLSLASCACCKQFGHVSVNCSLGEYSGVRGRRVVSEQDRVRLAGIYKRKLAPVAHPVSFGGKTWAQVAGHSPSRVVSLGAPDVSLVSGSKAFSMDSSSSGAADLGGCLAVLKRSMEILAYQVSLILKKLSFIDLVPLAPSPSALPLVSSTAVVSDMDSGLDLDSMLLLSVSSSSNVGGSVVDFSPSSSKVLTAKIGGLESNMMALEASVSSVLDRLDYLHSGSVDVVCWHVSSGNMVSFITETKLRFSSGPWIKDKFDGVQIFSSGLDKSFMGAGVAIVMNTSLARHVSKVEEIPGRVISVQLLFKGKLSVTVLGLYAGASSGARFGQASEVNTLIAKAVNSSNFVILGGDLNENGSGRSASFNEKTVAIPINQGVKVASLDICSQPISIAKKGEAHQYLGIFLSTEGLSKLSVAKAHADVRFFVNVVLKKAITDKQFSYLVSAVLQPIVSYRTQFSFVSFNVCHKWDVLVRKGLRSKACLPHDFPNAALHHPSLYGLKPFEQVQSEGKVAALMAFSNAFGILGHLFRHRFLDLQVLGWASLDPLQFPVRLRVSPVNNFLAGMVKIFLGNELTLVNNLPTAFRSPGQFLLSSVLGKSLYFDSVKSLKCFGVAFGDRLFDKKGVLLDWKTFRRWKRLDPRGPVPHWFMVSSEFLKGQGYSFSGSVGSVEKLGLDILGFGKFSAVKDGLHDIWSGFFEVFTDGSLRNAGSAEVTCGAAAYFLVLDKSIGVAVHGLLSSIMAELQAVALALECVFSSSTVVLRLDSQAAIDTCVSEMSLVAPDFRNQC
ncbi:hypothetical protein G9A89_020974 [Geosiphon pyriformis]|nr:hypothetical protein G9A89_020974 [Geosiphon pyriformis]